MWSNWSIIGVVALIAIAAIIAIIIAVVVVKVKAQNKNLSVTQGGENAAVAAKRKSKLKTNIIIAVSIIALIVAGIAVTVIQNRKADISEYYGVYECQVEQGEAHTIYRISIDEPLDLNGVKAYWGTYSASSSNANFGFNYTMEYSIKDGNITIKFNQGQTISGTFTDGNLIINLIGSQTNLFFLKIK